MMRLALLAVLVASAAAFYSSSDDVVQLDTSNFDKLVMQGDEVWLIEFYAPWCGHCQSLTPAWKKAATALKGVVKIGAVDADKHNDLGGKYGVRGFPTIKIFGADKNKPKDYQSGRDAKSIVAAGLDAAKSVVMDRLGGGGGGGKKSSGGGSGGGSGGVIELTDANFDELVYGSEELMLVEFYAPWCGHCKNLAPEWAKAAAELKGKAKVAALDATAHQVVASRFNIRGYPTIKVFPAGKRSSPSDAEEYQGPREADGIIRYAMDRVVASLPPPELIEVTSQKVVDDNCGQHLCVIAFLPLIYDCQSKCRNDHMKMLKSMTEKHKQRGWGWLWAEATAQPQLEEALGVGGFGYPAMVALSSKKLKYAMFKGSFGPDGVHDFLRTVGAGRGGSASLPQSGLPKVLDIDAWDGKDKELPKEEDDFDEKDEL